LAEGQQYITSSSKQELPPPFEQHVNRCLLYAALPSPPLLSWMTTRTDSWQPLLVNDTAACCVGATVEHTRIDLI
jgi:hypothetical protein